MSAPTVPLQPSRHGSPVDAYRIFFPLGVVLGIAGVSIWPLFHWGVVDGYSGTAHAFIQTNCFLYAFIVGFLWTAVPRFTGTEAPGRRIQFFMAALLIAETMAFELYYFSTAHALFVVSHTILISVLARRFAKRLHPPPETFVLVGFGVLAGLMAATLNAGIAFGLLPSGWALLGKRLLTEGMVLMIVLGVGGFLGPRLMGFAQLPNFQKLERLDPSPARLPVNRKLRLNASFGLVLLVSLILQYGWSEPGTLAEGVLRFTRTTAGTLLVLLNVRPWRLPFTRTTLSWGVWMAHWFLIAGLWLVALFPNEAIAYFHIVFMGAFSLLIFAVGTRVVLSHGGHSLAEENRSTPLRVGIVTTVIAMSARVFATFASSPQSYFSHLAWAAVLWVAGMLVWGTFIVRRLRTREIEGR